MNDSAIAIIGMSCRFPGADSVEQFWRNLCEEVESVSFFSDEELLAAGVDPTFLADPNYVKAGTILPGVDLFDTAFFGFTPREAEIIDPQQRLFLECAQEALENAGYHADAYAGAIGVFAGAGISSYLLYHLQPNRALVRAIGDYQLVLGNDKDFLPTRVSYKLNLKGPSVTVQTACSTSLVAVHLAGQSLLEGECDMALAGGVSIPNLQKTGYWHQEGMIFSPDGHCRAFDAKAQGIVGGCGLGIVVLKRLEEALADGDTIRAVIKGSAINNDGALKVGYTAPSGEGQVKVIREAQAIAEVEPETITYVETHGTATALGDPIEIAALTQAFQNGKGADFAFPNPPWCAIGSVKTNIGHADAAAGVAGLIKTVLALKHRQIPPSLHFETPNPKIDFANSPFYVNAELSEWKANGTLRRAGVSSFGIGGTNAHVVLEEAPAVEPSSPSRPWQLLLLSAKTSSALDTATANLANHLAQHPDLNLADMAYTLQVGRQRHPHRRMLICQGIDDAVNALRAPERLSTQFSESTERPVVFMFSGQGSQYVSMARELYELEPTFRETVASCAALLEPHLGLDIRQLLYPDQAQADEAAHQLEQTAFTQPALFVIEYALARLWQSWGIEPHALIGHSIGEYVAACLASVFSLEDALALIALRGRLMQPLPAGAMLAVLLPEQALVLPADISLAAVNGPSHCVVSGPLAAIDTLRRQLAEQGVECRALHTSHAFHSAMMEPVMVAFTAYVGAIHLQAPQIPYVSNVTGTWITAAEATDTAYWARHLRQTVRFAQGLDELLKEPELILLEMAPGHTLSTFVRQYPGKTRQVVLPSIRHPHEAQSDLAFLLKTVGWFWLAGGQADWAGFYADERRQRVPLPTYPFERQRYWIDPPQTQPARPSIEPPRKKPEIADWFYVPSWKRMPLALAQPLAERLRWLLFVDDCGVGDELATRLRTAGQEIISVRVGVGFARQSSGSYTLNPQRKEDYQTLIQSILAQGKRPQWIVHLWSVTASPVPLDIKLTKAVLDQSFYSLLFLAQALHSITDEIQLAVVTNNLEEVTGEELLCPAKATLLGPLKVIAQEYPNLRCRSIDVVLKQPGSATLLDQLLTELTANAAVESPDHATRMIAYRGKHRWVQTFEPVRPVANYPSHTQRAIKQGGVYLITGGLGGIGLFLAEQLANFQAKLILIGRSVFPERSARAHWLATHAPDDATSRRIKKVQALEKLGAQVLVFSADVADENQMRRAIEQAEVAFGCINGVIHAAGITTESFQSVQKIEIADCERHFQPKVYGLLVLQALLQGRNLDFCFLFSSLSSILGGLGFVAYAAANAFIDAFVHSHNQQNSAHWVTINWDGWRLREEAQSESTAREQNPTFGSSLAEFLITPPEGMAAFHAIRMGLLGEQIVVSTGDLQARLEKWITFTATRKADAEWAITGLSAHARPQLHNTYLAPRNQIEQKIAEVWQALLGIEKVGIHDSFFELGGDSLLIVQLRHKLQEALHHEFLTTDLFEHPTISALVESLRQTEVESATQRQAQDRTRNQRAALEEAAELKGRR